MFFKSSKSTRRDEDAMFSLLPWTGGRTNSAPTALVSRPTTTSLSGWKRLERWSDSISNWKTSILINAGLASTIFLLNLGLTIWAVKTQDDNGTVVRRKCSAVATLNTGIHFLLNVLSTLLLGASNYAMQCLSAPTREDIDRAHERDRWMDIGVPSLRNLRHLKWRNILFWVCLALSSLPLHLLYNSVFYMSIGNNSYDVYVASEAWLQGAWFDDKIWPDVVPVDGLSHAGEPMYGPPKKWTQFAFLNGTHGRRERCRFKDGWISKFRPCNYQTRPQEVQRFFQNDRSQYELLDGGECLDRYNNPYLSDRGNVVLMGEVLDRKLAFSPEVTLESASGRYHGVQSLSNKSSLYLVQKGSNSWNDVNDLTSRPEWLCGDVSEFHSCTSDSVLKAGKGHFRLNGMKITSCASQIRETCELRFNLPFAIIVLLMNLMKGIVMIAIYLTATAQPLLTAGDAIASFMNRPDEHTQGICLVTYNHFKFKKPFQQLDVRQTYRRRTYRIDWGESAGFISWIAVVIGWLACVGGAFAGYFIAVQAEGEGGSDGSGGTDLIADSTQPHSLIAGWALPHAGPSGMLAATIISNLPQVVLSTLYVLLNNFLTRMCLALEMARFQSQRKGLRVSYQPIGVQRATYFLQVPLRFGVPVVVASAVLHWLASESLYFVHLRKYGPQGERYGVTVTCGYSNIAVLTIAALAIIWTLVLIAVRLKRSDRRMPTTGSCSQAIAAACHPPPDGGDPALAVQWGAVPDTAEPATDAPTERKAVGHCTFSSAKVDAPIEGRLYA